MNDVWSENTLLIREPVKFAKAARDYDVLNPDTQEVLLEAREGRLGIMSKLLRFTPLATAMPFDIEVRAPGGQPVLRMSKVWSLASYQVTVKDGRERFLGRVQRQKVSVLDRFWVNEASEQRLFSLDGDHRQWSFQFKEGSKVLGEIRKEFANPLAELLTSADNYVLRIDEDVPLSPAIRKLMIACVLCVDLVFHG